MSTRPARRSGLLTLLGRTLGAIAGGYLGYVAFRGSRLLVQPEVRPLRPDQVGAPTTPGDLGLDFEEVRFQADDGVTLAGWLIPAARQTRAAVILLHGFTGHRLPELAGYVPWLQRRYHVLQFDFRGHGASDPAMITLGARERADVAAAVRFLQQHGFGPLALVGMSMGAAVAILAAPDLPVRAVVADSAFARLSHPITNRMREYGYPLAGIGARAILAGAAVRARSWLSSPIGAVGRIAPRGLLLIAAREDRLIEWTQARQLFEAANEPKELFVVDDAAHAEAHATAPAAYEARVLDFLERFLDGSRAAEESPPSASASASASV